MTRAEKIILVLCGIGGLLFAFALKAFGDDIIILTNETYRTVTFPSGDGANEITQVIDGEGNVWGESSTAVYVTRKSPWADVPPEQLEKYSRAVYYGDYEYIMVHPSVWCELTNTVEGLKDLSAQRWKKEHKTVAGREAWHGKATNRVISATSVTWLYADGYTYTETETNAVKRVRPPTAQKRLPSAPTKKPSPTLPPRLAEKREAMKSRAGEVREVNAVFGPGGKVLKVEEVAK